MDIATALQELDPSNDDHWTADGAARLDVLSAMVGERVTRQEVSDASPGFCRAKALEAAVGDGEELEANPVDDDVMDGDVDEAADVLTPEACASVPSIDDVVGMDPRVVFGDEDLIDRARAEFARQAEELRKRKEAIEVRLLELGRRTELLDRAYVQLGRHGRLKERANPVRAYLDRQNEARLKRAKAAQVFIQGGTTASDVAAALSGSSTIDGALARKTKRGGARPNYPLKD